MKTPTALLICKACSHGAEVRRDVKAALKTGGYKRELRAIGCGCFDICPKRGTAALLAGPHVPARCIIIDDAAAIDAAFVARLLDEGVRDAVPDENRLGGRRDGRN